MQKLRNDCQRFRLECHRLFFGGAIARNSQILELPLMHCFTHTSRIRSPFGSSLNFCLRAIEVSRYGTWTFDYWRRNAISDIATWMPLPWYQECQIEFSVDGGKTFSHLPSYTPIQSHQHTKHHLQEMLHTCFFHTQSFID